MRLETLSSKFVESVTPQGTEMHVCDFPRDVLIFLDGEPVVKKAVDEAVASLRKKLYPGHIDAVLRFEDSHYYVVVRLRTSMDRDEAFDILDDWYNDPENADLVARLGRTEIVI